jgi:alcohol dehydrogenase (cytochrome c)
MTLRNKFLTGCAGLALAAMSTSAFAVDPSRLLTADQNANDWLTHHGSYKSYHYAPADQINPGNVKNLEVAWTHFPERTTRGIQSTPLAADGVLYYSNSYSRVYALDGATGKVLWTYAPELDEATVAKQTHSPYNRGIALANGNLYVGTVDGRLIALEMKTGKVVFDTKLVDSKKLTVGFTGAPLAVKNMVIIGSQGGEWPGRGPIFGVDGKTGEKKWEFFTVAGTVWWGTANPAPLYDWSGADWKKSGPRPGDNLYTSSVIALDPNTGKLKFYHQELPHDAWDFDSAVGEFVSIDRGGQKLMVHPNKGGFIFVYDRNNGKIANVWQLVKNINFVKGIDPKTGELIGRRDLSLGKADSPLCPAISGGISWNSGAYSPKTGLYYKIGQEWCMDVTVTRTTPILEPMAQLNIGADFKVVAPPDGPPRGHLDARDPVTGNKKWEINFKEPPLSSILATGGNLLFVPDAEGVVHAYNAETGQELWSHGVGIGHNAGIISYMAGGKQYVAVPAGWGSLVSDDFAALYGEPFKSFAKNTGALFVYALKQ